MNELNKESRQGLEFKGTWRPLQTLKGHGIKFSDGYFGLMQVRATLSATLELIRVVTLRVGAHNIFNRIIFLGGDGKGTRSGVFLSSPLQTTTKQIVQVLSKHEVGCCAVTLLVVQGIITCHKHCTQCLVQHHVNCIQKDANLKTLKSGRSPILPS